MIGRLIAPTRRQDRPRARAAREGILDRPPQRDQAEIHQKTKISTEVSRAIPFPIGAPQSAGPHSETRHQREKENVNAAADRKRRPLAATSAQGNAATPAVPSAARLMTPQNEHRPATH